MQDVTDLAAELDALATALDQNAAAARARHQQSEPARPPERPEETMVVPIADRRSRKTAACLQRRTLQPVKRRRELTRRAEPRCVARVLLDYVCDQDAPGVVA